MAIILRNCRKHSKQKHIIKPFKQTCIMFLLEKIMFQFALTLNYISSAAAGIKETDSKVEQIMYYVMLAIYLSVW